MKHGLVAALFCSIAVLCMGAGSKAKGYLVTFHLEGDEQDTAKFVTPVKLGTEHRQYFFRKMPAFSDKDIAWFYPFVAEDGQSFGAAFRLIDHKAQEFAGITVANQGKLFGTRVLDAPLRAVIIDRPINDGIVVIWSGLSKDHVKMIGSKITHVDKISGTGSSVPSFELPEVSGTNQQGEQAPKKGFKLFGKGFLKKNPPAPVNPFVNPPQ